MQATREHGRSVKSSISHSLNCRTSKNHPKNDHDRKLGRPTINSRWSIYFRLGTDERYDLEFSIVRDVVKFCCHELLSQLCLKPKGATTGRGGGGRSLTPNFASDPKLLRPFFLGSVLGAGGQLLVELGQSYMRVPNVRIIMLNLLSSVII
jgi:hypothetical protein